ncbi:MAG: hypothetical protein EPN38_08395 [Rhodanobacteraceae bacterium]|nr:MAG: hypothetical protein EPN38_08395 [Rhodanobacteraceae bacterium]
MNIRYTRFHAGLLALAAGLVAGHAQALTVHDLKGQHLEAYYGAYAPRGDCQREPRITVDDSGFTYHYHGQQIHPATFEWAVSYFGPEYQGITNYFFPFPEPVIYFVSEPVGFQLPRVNRSWNWIANSSFASCQ